MVVLVAGCVVNCKPSGLNTTTLLFHAGERLETIPILVTIPLFVVRFPIGSIITFEALEEKKASRSPAVVLWNQSHNTNVAHARTVSSAHTSQDLPPLLNQTHDTHAAIVGLYEDSKDVKYIATTNQHLEYVKEIMLH